MKILVVDDEPDIKLLFEQRFRREIKSHEMDFIFAFSGEEALQILKRNNQKVLLILSDINMPGMSGFELLKQVKALHPQPPPVVMMITAYGDSDNLSTAMSLGAQDFLSKPIDFITLKEKLQSIS
jgi:two-component system, chemotaxis family, chemotaxis protein CheY